MYDSITSHLVRLARRSWLIIVLALAIGAVLGGLVAERRQSWTGTATIQVTDVSTAVSLLGLTSIETTTGLRPIVVRSAEEFQSTATDTTITATQDEEASVIVAVATGPDSASIESALNDFEAIVERQATDPRVVEADAALRANEATLQLYESDLAAVEEQLATLDAGDPERLSLVESRTGVQTDIRLLESTIEALRQYRSILESPLVVTIGSSTNGPSSVARSAIVGVLAMGVILTIVGAALVITDQKIRRRLQVERILPGIPILGVLSKGTGQTDERREAARSIDRFVESAGADTVIVVELDGALAAPELRPLATSTLVEHDGDADVPDAPVVVVAAWGRSTENEVTSKVASLETAGNGCIALIIAGVPPRDLDWAGATGRGADAASMTTQ